MIPRALRLFLYFAIGLLIGGVSVVSFAGTAPANTVYLAGSFSGSTGSDACSKNNSATFEGYAGYFYGSQYFVGSCKTNGSSIANVRLIQSCEGIGGNLIGSLPDQQCECPGTQIPESGQCKEPNPCSDKSGKYYNNGNGMESTANLVGGDGAFSGDTSGSKMPDTFCLKGCLASTENLDGGAAGTSWYGYGNPKFSGQKCGTSGSTPQTEATAKAPPSPEYDCAKAGKGFGYVNNVVMCVDINKTQENKTNTSTSTKPDGSKTETKNDTTVKCDGTNCVTTTTTTTIEYNSSGTQTSQSQTSQSTSKPDPSASGASGTGTKGDSSFCAENPSSAMCKQGAFTGNCASGFTCEGDPAACASAKALQEQKCEQSKAAESLAAHADENLIQFDQAKADAALNKDGAKDLKLNEIWESKKQTYLNFAKGCPVSERTFTLMGTTYTFDLSIVCTIGEFVSVLMHLAAYMFALRLFQRTVF